MGRKAWLFLGNHTAGETAASLYTLIMSCKRHCIDPQSYLLDVLNRVKTATADELEDLLPDRWILSHPEAYVEQRAQESAAAADRKRTRRQARRPRLAAS
ncbi:MAG: transposase domain-containing protein [Pirellulales bacterium]